MMIDAEIYGMMLSAKMAMRPTAPPENMLNMPRMPDWFCRNTSASACGLMPGIGI